MYIRENDSLESVHAIAALKRIFIEQHKQFQTQIYIPLNIGHSLQDDSALSAEVWLEQFSTTAEKTHLLFSEGGGGKSSFCYWLAEKLWERHSTDSKQPMPLILRVSLQENLTKNTLFNYIKQELLKDTEILENLDYQVENLKKLPMVILLDGFDELPSEKQGNLWRQLALYQWTIDKVLITCRPEALIYYDYHNKQDLFKTHISADEAEENSYVAYYAQPFTSEQVAAYLEYYQALKQTEINYQELFNNLPELNAFTSNPYVLYLCAEALPDIIKKISEKEEKAKVYHSTRLAIYKIFTDKWIKNHAKKLLETGEIHDTEYEIIQRYAGDFCAALAARLWGQEKWVIEYDPTEQSKTIEKTKWVRQDYLQLFSMKFEFNRQILNIKPPASLLGKNIWLKLASASESARDYLSFKRTTTVGGDYSRFFCKEGKYDKTGVEIQLLLRGCPLRYLGEDKGVHRYEFFHKSLLEYFASKQMFTSVSYHASFSLGCALNDRLLNSQPSIIRFVADQVKNNAEAKVLLRQVVDESKHEPRVMIAAANAMTILNAVGVDFSREDFSRVRIKGANLVGAMCIGTNFTEADLRDVEWVGAQLDHADFTRACVSHRCRWRNDGVILSYLPDSYSSICRKLSPDGRWLIDARSQNKIYLSTLDGKLIRKIKIRSTGFSSVCISSNSKFIVTGFHDPVGFFTDKKTSTIKIWKAATGRHIKSLEGFSENINLVVISPDCTRLISGSGKYLRLWDLAQACCLSILGYDYYFQKCVSFSHDSKTFVTFNQNRLKIWNAANGKLLQLFKDEVASVSCLTHSPNDEFIVSAERKILGDNILKIRSAINGECLKILTGHHTKEITCITVSPDSKRIASGSKDTTVKIWDIVSGQCLYTLVGHSREIRCVSFKSNEDLVSSSADRTVRQWNVTSEVLCLKNLEGDVSSVTRVEAFPDEQRSISSSQDKTMKRWYANNWEAFIGHTQNFTCIAASPGVGFIASGNTYRGFWKEADVVCIWDITTGDCVQTFFGHTEKVTCVCYWPDGQWVLSGSLDRTIKVWDLASGKCLSSKNLQSAVNSIDCIDASQLKVGLDDSLRIYRVNDQGKFFLQCYISQAPIPLSADNLVLNNTYGLLHEYRDTDGEVIIEETPAAKLLKQLGGIGNLSRKSCEDVLEIHDEAIPYKDPIPSRFIFPGFSSMLCPNGNSSIALCYDKMSENPLHAFLLMESVEEGYYKIRRIDAFIDERANKSKVLGMTWKGKVHIEMANKTLTDTCELLRRCRYKAFVMNPEQAQQLLTTITQEIMNPPPYLLMGDYSFFRPLTGFEKGHNCITWCTEKLIQIGLQEELSNHTTWTETFNDIASNNVTDGNSDLGTFFTSNKK